MSNGFCLISTLDSESKLLFIPAVPIGAGQEIALPLGVLFNQVRCAAYRTGFGDRFIPGGEGAGRISAASIEYLAALGSLFHNFPVTPALGAVHTDFLAVAAAVDGFGVCAFGKSAAGQKFTVFAAFDDHRPAAAGT